MLRCRPVFRSPRSGPALGFLGFLAWIVIATGLVHAAPLPSDLMDTLAHFHPAGPKGWSFLQTTESAGQSLVEYFDAIQPANERWSLRQKNGRPPTKEELADYSQGQALNSATFTAPRIQDQIDLTTAVLVRRDDTRSVWRFQMKPSDDDKTSRYMTVTVTYHQPTHTIEQVEIANLEPFSPVLAVKISETRTVMTYSLPSAESPSQLQRVTLLVRGQAFWFKTLDQDMTVTFSGHVWAGKK